MAYPMLAQRMLMGQRPQQQGPQFGLAGQQPPGMMQPPPPGMAGPMAKADGDGAGDLRTDIYTPADQAADAARRAGGGGPADDVRTPPPDAGGSGGLMANLPSWITDQIGNFSGAMSNPLMIPSIAVAMQQFHQSRQYTDMAEHYADRLDPFGSQRGHYQDLMRDSYDNPTKVLQDPAYQAQLKFELGNVGIANAGKGWDGSGNMMAALSDRQHNMDEQHIQDYRKGLAPLTGAQFGPDVAGHMLETGLAGRMGAENNAVGSLMMPFMNQNANNRSPGGGTGGQAGANSPAGLLNQATNLLKNPSQLPAAMRNWPPQQLADWLKYNNQLGNDSFGQWASGNTGADGGYNPGNIVLPGQGYQFPGGSSFGGDGGTGGGGLDWSGGDGGIDWSQFGGNFNDIWGSMNNDLLDPGFWDLGSFG